MADPAPQDPTPTPEPAPTDPPAASGPAEPAAKQPPWGDPENFNPEKAWELIQSLRASDRPGKVTELETRLTEMQTAQQQQMDALAKALGLKSDDTPPDPEKLTQEVGAAQEQARVAQRELAVYRLAGTHEANANELLDSASFLASIKDVDPTDQAAMDAAIKAAVESNPKFKASTTSPTPPFPGGPRTPAPKAAGSLGEAIAGRFAGNNR